MAITPPVWVEYIPDVSKVFGVIPSTICLGIVANCIMVLVTFMRMGPLQLQHNFMLGLTVLDMLSVLPCATAAVATLSGSIWLTGTLCNAIGLLFVSTIGATTWIHSCMCVEKCVAILRPTKHQAFSVTKISKYVMIGLISLCYTLPVVVSLIFLHFSKHKIIFSPYMAHCACMDKYFLILTGCSFLILPLLTAAVIFIVLLVKIRKWKSHHLRLYTRALRATKVTIFTVILYYSCWIPTLMHIILITILGARMPKPFLYMTNCIITANRCLSSLIYTLSLKRFRTQLQRRGVPIRPSVALAAVSANHISVNTGSL